jgi:hypothetical protein
MAKIERLRELISQIASAPNKNVPSVLNSIEEVTDGAESLLKQSRKVGNIKISLQLYDEADSLMENLTRAVIQN